MFGQKKKDKLDLEIERLETLIQSYKPSDEEYEVVAKNLETLHQIRNSKPGTVKIDVILNILAMLGQTLLMLNHEKLHVISSKVLGFLWKGRP